MSDIFISYSKADHALALKLSAFLEAEGWTVWWDKSLAAADLYRDEIMKQLAAARAVITIWSANSIKSDWVRAEAGRAKAEGKLIPVKTTDVAYADIPLPFGEMHTENVGSIELIRAAIVAQLAKPAIPVAPFWQITGVFKYQVLTWIGIIGSAITVYAGLSTILDVADWAKWLVSQWHDWTQMFWERVFSLIGMQVPKEFVPLMSFITFSAILVIGTVWRHSRKGVTWTINLEDSKYLTGGGVFLWSLLAICGGIVYNTLAGDARNVHILYIVVFGLFIILLGYGTVKRFRKEWLLACSASALFSAMVLCLLIVPYIAYNGNVEELGVVFLVLGVCWNLVMFFVPLRELTQRLMFVVLGVLTLIGLSEISKFNLHQYLQPPKVSDNSVR